MHGWHVCHMHTTPLIHSHVHNISTACMLHEHAMNMLCYKGVRVGATSEARALPLFKAN